MFLTFLQTAPGVVGNRPQPGALPNRRNVMSSSGHIQWPAQVWYDGLIMNGNTSINPFFYGTYLAETKPFEPVSRTKKQAFQADAVGVAHQLTPAHFKVPHTFRLEWQPGRGGRLDWFVKGHRVNETTIIEGDGLGEEWTHAYGLKDVSLEELMGSQIPIEPSYLIMNTAISSTWGFPYDAPAWCPKCYDCKDPTCACSFAPGFCSMVDKGNLAMYVDFVRVYQSRNDSAHVGAPHTLGCDPPDYPTKEWIEGHSYRYMRNPPFSYNDLGPLRRVQKGGGSCKTDADCGGDVQRVNLTAVYEGESEDGNLTEGRGTCGFGLKAGLFSALSPGNVCRCNEGYTGPHCMSIAYSDNFPSAHAIRMGKSPFSRISNFEAPTFMLTVLIILISSLLMFLVQKVRSVKKERYLLLDKSLMQQNTISTASL